MVSAARCRRRRTALPLVSRHLLFLSLLSVCSHYVAAAAGKSEKDKYKGYTEKQIEMSKRLDKLEDDAGNFRKLNEAEEVEKRKMEAQPVHIVTHIQSRCDDVGVIPIDGLSHWNEQLSGLKGELAAAAYLKQKSKLGSRAAAANSANAGSSKTKKKSKKEQKAVSSKKAKLSETKQQSKAAEEVVEEQTPMVTIASTLPAQPPAECDADASSGPLMSVTLGTVQGYYIGERNNAGRPDGWGAWGALNTPSSHEWPGTGYIGQWVDDARHGIGYGWWPDGRVYAGDWNMNQMSGLGLFNGSNGVQYAGEWIKGRQEGWGMQWGGVEGGLYVGEWHDGAAQGRGTSVNNKGSYWVGSWENGARRGPGKWNDANGKTHTGSWEQNILTGLGTTTFADGSIYVGSYVDGRAHGTGIVTKPEGNMYVGQFTNGISELLSERTAESKKKEGEDFLHWVQKQGGEHTIKMASIVLKREQGMRQLGYYSYCVGTSSKMEIWGPIQMLALSKGEGPEILHLSTKLDLLGSVPHVVLRDKQATTTNDDDDDDDDDDALD